MKEPNCQILRWALNIHQTCISVIEELLQLRDLVYVNWLTEISAMFRDFILE